MKIERLDHLVLTVRDIGATCDWYSRVLAMRIERFGAERIALRFGDQKINLHQAGREWEPKAARPTPGAADLCFISATPLDEIQTHLAAQRVAIEQGPVERTGATGPIRSIYVRDLDGNLIEIANLINTDAHE